MHRGIAVRYIAPTRSYGNHRFHHRRKIRRCDEFAPRFAKSRETNGLALAMTARTRGIGEKLLAGRVNTPLRIAEGGRKGDAGQGRPGQLRAGQSKAIVHRRVISTPRVESVLTICFNVRGSRTERYTVDIWAAIHRCDTRARLSVHPCRRPAGPGRRTVRLTRMSCTLARSRREVKLRTPNGGYLKVVIP